ncbi:galactose-1-phosphate uridylyltransferase [Chloroflexota bacterium]
MSELRLDQTTKEWVIMAPPERGKRPQHMSNRQRVDELPERDDSCPFCPGNEDQTPSAVLQTPDPNDKILWSVRVVPNRFAALALGGNTISRGNGHFSRKMDGVGEHEVIIESPSHNTPMALMPYQQIERVLQAYQQRYNTLKKNRQFKFITIFKNHGWESGTSLAHPHSQLVATPIIATYYRRKFNVSVDYFYDTGKCLFCDMLVEEMEKKERVVVQTNDFVVLHPFASRVLYETWIIPRKHSASFGLFPKAKLNALAMVLKDCLLCLYRDLDNPAFNLMVDTTTTEDEEDPYCHWHIRIVPRLTTIAGFEMGSGIHINTSLPEDTAKIIRQAAHSLPEDEMLSFNQKG